MLRNLFLKIGMSALGGWVRDVAAGKKGPGLKKVYDRLEGYKTFIGFLLGATAVALAALGYAEPAGLVAIVAGFVVSVGLADKAWKSAPSSWTSKWWWTKLRDWWIEVSAVLGVASNALLTCEPALADNLARFHMTCEGARVVVVAIIAIGGWLIAEAMLARPPVEPMAR